MTSVPLVDFATVVLNGAGAGTAQLGPVSARETWSPSTVHVSVNSAINEAVCNIYAGDVVTQSNFRDNTFSGSSGDSTDRVDADILRVGSKIFAVWTGGDPGATAKIAVTGTKEI